MPNPADTPPRPATHPAPLPPGIVTTQVTHYRVGDYSYTDLGLARAQLARMKTPA